MSPCTIVLAVLVEAPGLIMLVWLLIRRHRIRRHPTEFVSWRTMERLNKR